MKTDNPTEVGQHIFERAGLGQPPYRISAVTRNVYCACPGAPTQPGGTCDYCSNSIMDEFWLVSNDGKRFKVGSSCIEKSGDRGLIKAYKNSPDFRKLQADKRRVKAEAVHKEIESLLANRAAELKNFPPPNDMSANLYEHLVWWFNHAGASGQRRVLAFTKQVMSGEKVYNQEEKYYVRK